MASFLDSLEPAARLAEVRSLAGRAQAQLYEAAAGFRPVTLAGFVPAATPPLQEVIHHGRNSLPILHFFEKRFCRPATPEDELWGYNEWTFKALTGPGYFVARQASDFEVLIAYDEIPPDKPASWPRILPNSARLGRFVYDGLHDYVRGVSRHVSIGRANREGKALDNWFVICRAGE
jgi:hypothetical protein